MTSSMSAAGKRGTEPADAVLASPFRHGACREPFCPGPNVAFFEIPNELVDAAKCEISSEDPSDQFSFFFNDGNLAVLHLIAEGQGASNPQTLPLGGRDLVADPLGGNFPLKLGKGQEHVERQPPHRGRGVELLCDRDE